MIQQGDDLRGGSIPIRTAENRQGACPANFLHEVWTKTNSFLLYLKTFKDGWCCCRTEKVWVVSGEEKTEKSEEEKIFLKVRRWGEKCSWSMPSVYFVLWFSPKNFSWLAFMNFMCKKNFLWYPLLDFVTFNPKLIPLRLPHMRYLRKKTSQKFQSEKSTELYWKARVKALKRMIFVRHKNDFFACCDHEPPKKEIQKKEYEKLWDITSEFPHELGILILNAAKRKKYWSVVDVVVFPSFFSKILIKMWGEEIFKRVKRDILRRKVSGLKIYYKMHPKKKSN